MPSTHYSKALDPSELLAVAESFADSIKAHMDNHPEAGLPVLLYQGMSGIASATAIALSLWQKHRVEAKMMYIRKDNEKSHGGMIEASDRLFYEYERNEDGNYEKTPALRFVIFVDDFISSGTTAARCERMLQMREGQDKKIDFYALTQRYPERIVPEGHVNTLRYGL